MISLNEFQKIIRVDGVDQYILVNSNGNIAAHKIDAPQKAAEIVLTCGKNSSAIGKARFEHLLFSRENQKNFFIFPVGKYYLGVVKQDNINNATLVGNIVNFLKDLQKRQKKSQAE